MSEQLIELRKHLASVNSDRFWEPSPTSLQNYTVGLNYQDSGFSEITDRMDLASIRSEILTGRGFYLFKVLNAKSLSDSELIDASGVLADLIGKRHSQNKAGDTEYRVEDLREQDKKTYRFSKSNLDSTFHTDCSYRDIVPSIVSLFCIRPAFSGGVSQMSSVYDSLKVLVEERPEVIEMLLQSFVFDRRGTEQPGEQPVGSFPILNLIQDELAIRYLRPYIEIGQDRVGAPLDAKTSEALTKFDRLNSSDANVLNYRLERGECLVCNNVWVLHNRTEFKDRMNGKGRLLMRHWLE